MTPIDIIISLWIIGGFFSCGLLKAFLLEEKREFKEKITMYIGAWAMSWYFIGIIIGTYFLETTNKKSTLKNL